MAEICRVHRLGKIDYLQAWEIQNRLAEEIARGIRPPTLLLLEHPHTYTFGRRGQVKNLLWDGAELEKRAVGLHWVDRGGDITYHGPGQLVGYPLLPLGVQGLHQIDQNHLVPRADYIGYLRRLEDVLIRSLASLDVSAVKIDGLTGVWIQPQAGLVTGSQPSEQHQPAAKIAAIGVKVDARGVTRHGFALNIATDPEYWQGIIACGISDHPVINLSDLHYPPPAIARVMDAVSESFGAVFQYEIQEASLV